MWKWWLLLAISLSIPISARAIATVACNFNGTQDGLEECDDGNMQSNDGCTNCTLDPIQLDFNTSDPTSTGVNIEFFKQDTVIFFAPDADTLGLSFTPPTLNLARILLLMIGDSQPTRDDVDIFTEEAFTEMRTGSVDFTGFFDQSRIIRSGSDPRLEGLSTYIDMSQVTAGMIITANSGDSVLSLEVSRAVVLSAGYEANTHPGYDPRMFCVILTDDVNAMTTSCVNLFFIGLNDDPPIVNYTSGGATASFVEEQTEPVSFVIGTISVSDQDHPSRYLQVSARALIVNYTEGDMESLSTTYEHPGFTYRYDDSVGALTISGEANTETYSSILSNLTYFNNMSEPTGTSRQIDITVFDGIHRSQPAPVLVNIINTNDAPVVSLSGEDPVVTSLSVNYTEQSGNVLVASDLVIVDVDPNAMIQRVTVRLTNPQDGGRERLGLSTTNTMGITLGMTDSMITFTGTFLTSVYTTVVSLVTYENRDKNPATSVVRLIEFEVEDSEGAINAQNSILQMTILPVNDPPILSFTDNEAIRGLDILFNPGVTSRMFQYTEDDPPLNFGRDIYLRDDSNISSTTVVLEGLLNGAQDVVSVDESLLVLYGISATHEVSNGGTSRRITFTGEATPLQHEEVLRSLTYQNLHTTNQLTDGVRTATVTANDTEPLTSDAIAINITVGDRNDPPLVDLGAGDGLTLNVTFREEGPSVPIVLPHLLSVAEDEELHNISNVTVELTATNGALDPSDAIFLRSPLALRFLDNFREPPTTRRIAVSLLDEAATSLEELLLSIYYDNGEREPTYFGDNGERLNREVVVSVTDANFLREDSPHTNLDDDFGVGRTMVRARVFVELVNDNRPRINIVAEPDGCGLSSSSLDGGEEGVVGMSRRRRDVRGGRARMKKALKSDRSKAPSVTSVHASFDPFNCLDTITVSFESNTSIPIVERKLEAILSFDAPELRAAKKHGLWFDHSTLVVVFMECPVSRGGGVEEEEEEERERPLYVLLEAERGNCDWSTTCSNDTICFQNKTGCPVTGSYRVTTNTSCQPGEKCPEAAINQPTTEQHREEEEEQESTDSPEDSYYYQVITTGMLVITLVTIGLGLVFSCAITIGRNFSPSSSIIRKQSSDQLTATKVVPVHEIKAQQSAAVVVTLPLTEETSLLLHQEERGAEPESEGAGPGEGSADKVSPTKLADTHKRRKKAKRKPARRERVEPRKVKGRDALLTQQSSSSEEEEEEEKVKTAPLTLLPLERSHEQSCDTVASAASQQRPCQGSSWNCSTSNSNNNNNNNSSNNSSNRELLLNLEEGNWSGCVATSDRYSPNSTTMHKTGQL